MRLGHAPVVLGPCRCQGCRVELYWNGWSWYDRTGGTHVCMAPVRVVFEDDPTLKRRSRYHDRPPCGEWMPRVGERCGRRAGHGDSHRSSWAMRYDREHRRRPTARIAA